MDFIKGMDISTLPEMEALGFIYKNFDGTPIDAFDLIKENGVNSVRLRIWNDPENFPESHGYCNLADTVKMAQRIKAHGMSFFLDFHYSDYWADPGQQRKPKAWEGLSYPELTEALHDFTRDTLSALENAGAYPDYIQIGNEIRSGMVFPEGDARNFRGLAGLINAGIRAVRELDDKHASEGGKIPRVKIVIHLDQGGRYFYYEDWFDKALANGVTDFDIIALSYYPFWHGTYTDFKNTLEKVVKRYRKPVMCAETAHAWRFTDGGFVSAQHERLSNFRLTPEDQRKVVELVMSIVASVSDNMGLGVYYWEPLDIPRKGMDGWPSNMTIIRPDCIPMEALKAFRFDPALAKEIRPVKVLGFSDSQDGDSFTASYNSGTARRLMSEAIAKSLSDGNFAGFTKALSLPETATLLLSDGTQKESAVSWLSSDLQPSGNGNLKVTFDGKTIEGDLSFKYEVKIAKSFAGEMNLLPVSTFGPGLPGWKIESDSVKTEPRDTELYFEGEGNFTLTLSQVFRVERPGRYRFSLEYLGTNTTGTEVHMYIQAAEHRYVEWIYPHDTEWLKYELCDIETKEPCDMTFAIVVKAPPVYGRIRNLIFCADPGIDRP